MSTEPISQAQPISPKHSAPRDLLPWLFVIPFIILLLISCGLASLWGMRPMSGGNVRSNLEVDYAPWGVVAFQPLSTGIVFEVLRDWQNYPVETPLPTDYLRNTLPSLTPSDTPSLVPTSTSTDKPPTATPIPTKTFTATTTPTLTSTATRTRIPPTRYLTATHTSPPPSPPNTSTNTPPTPNTPTNTNAPTNTRTNTPVNTQIPSATATHTLTLIPTPSHTHTSTSIPTSTDTGTPTLTSTVTETGTATHTPADTTTNTATVAPVVLPDPGGGQVSCGSPINIDLGADMYLRYVIYYEWPRNDISNCAVPGGPAVPGVCLDWISLDASLDNANWVNYYFWGDGNGGNNGSVINPAAPSELDNQPIPGDTLYGGSGILIPIYEVTHYLRFNTTDCPGNGGNNDVAQVRQLHIYP